MKRRSGLLFVVVAISLAIAGYRWGYSRLVAPLAAGQLEIPAEYLDFGTVVVQDDFVYRLPVENRSSQTVEIAAMDRSCGCASVTPASFTSAPFESRWLQLNLDLRGGDAFAYSGDERDFAVELRPVYAKAMTPGETWRVTGKIQSPFRVLQRPLRFAPDALIAGSEFKPLGFTIEPRVPIKEVRVELASKSATAQVTSERRGDTIQVILAPDCSLSIGAHDFRLSITMIGAEGATLTEQTLSVPGRVVSDVEVEPAYLRLDASADDETSNSQVVKLKSHTGTPFEILGVELPGAMLSVSPLTVEASNESEATFAVTTKGAGTELSVRTVTFHLRSGNVRAGDFVVPLQVVMCSP